MPLDATLNITPIRIRHPKGSSGFGHGPHVFHADKTGTIIIPDSLLAEALQHGFELVPGAPIPVESIVPEETPEAIEGLSGTTASPHIIPRRQLPPVIEVKKVDKPEENESLIGSSVQPGTVELPNKNVIQLGAIVRKAFETSGFTVEEWNALADDDRESRIQAALDLLIQEAEPTKV